MNMPDFYSGSWFLMLVLAFFLVITFRYLLVAGFFYAVFYVWFPERFYRRKINKRRYRPGQLKREIGYSLVSSALFAVAGAICVVLWQRHLTKVYTAAALYGWWYLPVSLLIYMLLQETYYYWVHRWMHRPAVFRLVHKVHHESRIASPFTAFSFHPLEGLLQAILLPLLLVFIPVHYLVLVVLLVIMTFSSVINHLDIEIYPEQAFPAWSRWVIGATHHAQHHKQFKYNFGLYFTFWDRLKKTESPLFQKKPWQPSAAGAPSHLPSAAGDL